MTKEEFIEILKTHAKIANVFGGRFIPISDDENYWNYHRPAVDAMEPSIDLSTEGFVIYNHNIGFDNKKSEKISYDDFIRKYKLKK